MFISQIWGLLVLFLITKAEILDFEEHTSDICLLCSCDTNRTIVDCSQRGLSHFPDGIRNKVLRLNISNNELTSFPINISRLYNLIWLDLSGNRINELPQDALQNLTALEVLNISRNDFQSWVNLHPNDVLKPVSNLKILDLSENKFETLANLANNELLISSSLETLMLEKCLISSIHGRSPLSGLTNIKVLRLDHNPLLRIKNLISPTLQSLYVSNCLLSYLSQNELSYLPSLLYLNLSHNYRLELPVSNAVFSISLRFLDISHCNVLKPNVRGFPNLRKVFMNNNLIRFLGNNEFTNNTKLEYLDLSYNSIGSIKKDTFRGLSMLRFLDLSWNVIADVPEQSFSEMTSLTQLDLKRNYLSRVGHLKSDSISILDLSSCEISLMGKDSLEGLPSLVDINLSRNLLSHIPDSISSSSLKYLNLNYNRLSSINNFTLFMLPRLTSLSVIGNRFVTVWNKSYFGSNPYLERLDLNDNMWRCDCADDNMFDFYEFITLEPNKKEESLNLTCNSPAILIGQTWFEACYSTWHPNAKKVHFDSAAWFSVVMIVGFILCLVVVTSVRQFTKRRLAALQEERGRQLEEARDRLRQIRVQAEQEALCNAPDPRDLIAPPSYDEALSMPKLNASCHSLNETGTGKTKRTRGRRKTKSSGDLLEETQRNGDLPVEYDLELYENENSRKRRRRRRNPRYGSHEIAELDQSPGTTRRRISEYITGDSVTIEVDAEISRQLPPRNRRFSVESQPRESDF